MKKPLILLGLFVFVLAVPGCRAEEGPVIFEAAYQPAAAEAVPVAVPEVYGEAYVTPGMLIGTWVLESQETDMTLLERVVIFDSGVKLLFSSDEAPLTFFWRVYGNVLSSFLHHRVIEMNIQINADGALVFTYDDGLTGTYVMTDYDFPERVVNPQFIGEWYFGF